jgi:hypothetical protein
MQIAGAPAEKQVYFLITLILMMKAGTIVGSHAGQR